MKTIIITGGTRGIGLGMARSFLKRDCSVMITGRTQEGLDRALNELRQDEKKSSLLGRICDVRHPQQVRVLWDAARQAFGTIDLWVNNAGISGDEAPLWELPPDEAAAVIETNVLGTIYGCQVAAAGMLEQGFGAIYNMEGMGSDGRMHKGLATYGTSKYATRYISQVLAKELADTPLIVGSLRPGMVATALVIDPYRNRPEEFERVKRIFNIIADTVENVSPWLVERMLTNTRSGVVLSYTSPLKLAWRFLMAPFVKRDLFSDR